MDDDAAMVRLIEQERLANPSEIRLDLVVDRYTRPNPRMHEKVIAKPAGIDEAPQEFFVLLRNGQPDDAERLFTRIDTDKLWIDSITLQTFEAALREPVRDQRCVSVEYP